MAEAVELTPAQVVPQKGRTMQAPASIRGINRLPVVKQVGLMIGLAASIALGVAVALWSQKPSFQLLYGNLAERDLMQVVEALDQAQIPYQVEYRSGAVMVPDDELHKAKLRLASQGLPQSRDDGFELMEKGNGFGVSQFMETARYNRALAGELARTIKTIRNVDSARVHLAMPRQTMFVNSKQKTTASVFVNLYPGRRLNKGQVDGIVHLVASSIPSLSPENVTVVDQKGRLLTSESDNDAEMAADHLEFAQRMEDSYVRRIEDLLVPIIGEGKIKAKVALSFEQTITEQTREDYEPDPTAIRSEQVHEETSLENRLAGVPGALANTPPGAGSAPEVVAGPGAGGETRPETADKNDIRTRKATRNYELDRVISHTRTVPGAVKRVSVAVVVDDRIKPDADGKPVSEPRSEEELARITELVKQAVGFNAERGDAVQVVNSSFYLTTEEAVEAIEEPIWQQPWVHDIAKQVLGAIGVLLLILMVLRPAMRNLTAAELKTVTPDASGQMPLLPNGSAAGAQAVDENGKPRMLSLEELAPSQFNYDNELDAAKALVAEDPKRVAQVVKTWISSDG
ncbi:MAG: flagellar basal-body MS-ring/collar protein FliF [Gammaproteobacteria bacterium]|nr:flagellar basal-body MS-ring/collar protein FliF [Gammaproteobacteria bacterium]